MVPAQAYLPPGLQPSTRAACRHPPLLCSFGEVYRGIWRQTDVAVKRLLDQEVSQQVGALV